MFVDAARAVGLWRRRWQRPSSIASQMAARAVQGWITVTELADTLTREHDVPFRTSHHIAASLIAEASRRPATPHGGDAACAGEVASARPDDRH